GLLPLVEKVFGPLIIPSSLRTSLVQQLDDATRAQPDVVQARQDALRAIDQSRVEVWHPVGDRPGESLIKDGINREWWSACEEVKRRKGLLVDIWPKLRRDGSVFVPPAEMAA